MKKIVLAITAVLVLGFCFATFIILKSNSQCGTAVFMQAAKTGNVQKLKECISSKINKDLQDENGMTALMHAASKNQVEVVKFLLKEGADREACHYRATALVYAVWNGSTACVQALLDAKAKTDICLRFNGDQGIFHLIPKENVEILHMLIQAGAPLNQTDDSGSTPLMDAVQEGNLRFVTILLNAGANPDIATYKIGNYGAKTPLMIAARKGFVDIIKALLTAKADTTLKDNKGKTALDYAATEEIKIILQAN